MKEHRPARASGTRKSGARLTPKSRMVEKKPLNFMPDDDSDAEDDVMFEPSAATPSASKCVSALSSEAPAFSIVFFEDAGGAMHFKTCKGTDKSQLSEAGMTTRGVSHMRQGMTTTPLKGKQVVENIETPINESVPLDEWSFFKAVPSGARDSEKHVPLSLVCATNTDDAAVRIAHAHNMSPTDYRVSKCDIPAPGTMAPFSV